MKVSIVSAVSFALFWGVNAQSTYPECLASACSAFRDAALSNCGYDISGAADSTVAQAQCMCTMDNASSLMQSCVACLELSSDPTVAASFQSVCSNTSPSASLSSSSTTSASPSRSSTTTASTSTHTASSTSTGSSGSSSTTSSDSSSSSTTTTDSTTTTTTTTSSTSTKITNPVTLRLPIPDPKSTNAAHAVAPGIGMAVMFLVAQAGL